MNPAAVTYVDVILPLALPRDYSYAVPVDLVEFIKVGQRVIVQFGKNKFYSAIVSRIHREKPAVEAKLIDSIADEDSIVTPTQLQFWQWMADYYLCTVGEVMNAALPAGLKLTSETTILMNEYYEGDYETLNSEEFLIVQALREQRELTIPKVQELLGKKNVYPALKTLFNKGIAIAAEEVVEKFKPRTESCVKLNDTYKDEQKLEALFEELKRAPKQVELLLAYTQLQRQTKYIKKQELLTLSKADASTLKKLCEKNIFIEYKMEVSRLGNLHSVESEIPPLSEDQLKALAEINLHFQTKNVVLLQGVTSSGKTMVYVEKIKEIIAANKQVLYLLPEIALTSQIVNRLRKIFGKQVGIYHSKFNQSERVEIWQKVLKHEYNIIIGARSGLLLPFADLGLIIVDEEHDPSLKQYDPNPRYQARDSAIVLANYFKAKVLLGSATPSVESLFNAERNKYGLVKLTKRYGGIEMPEIQLADLRPNRQKMQGSFSEVLVLTIDAALKNKEQVILFINRRGFANYQVCNTCTYIHKCVNCDVSLTYHKFQNRIVCHYCGYSEKVRTHCKNCGSPNLEIKGSGTEKIEDEILSIFPAVKVGRMDLDTTRSKHGHDNVIASFENKEIDILVGTQMVTKGLDFDNVSLVAIINADQLLSFPDFRTQERAFQLMQQVSGRAGRKNKRGKVIIQTANPDNPIIQHVLADDIAALYQNELLHRQQFNYPPFSRMIHIEFRHKSAELAERAAKWMAEEIRQTKRATVLGPTIPLIGWIKMRYLRDLIIKTDKTTTDLPTFKTKIAEAINRFRTHADFKGVDISVDVDP